MGWICIGFLTISLANVPVNEKTVYLETFSSEQKCLDYGQKWKVKNTNIHTRANFSCSEELSDYTETKI
jgi:hypothetical protein